MNSSNWSEGKKKSEKSSKVFTPNIYRKPITTDDREKEVTKNVSSSGPQKYISGANSVHTHADQEPVYSVSESDIEYLAQKESVLSDIKKRYESDISDYEEKQKELDELKSQFSEQEKSLRNKCAIMKSAAQRAVRAIPPEQTAELEKKINAFEQKRSAFEVQVKEFEDSRIGYEKELAEYTSKMEELSSLRSTYDSELKQYEQQRNELDEKYRSLEEQLSSGEEISIELSDVTYPAAIEAIKSSYYSELKELNRRRADIETLRSELEDEETLLTEKRSSIGIIKERIHTELVDLGPKTEELEASRFKFEKSVRAHKERELAFQDEVSALENKKAELESENEKLRLRREENTRLEESMDKNLLEMESKRKELEEMVERTNKEIGAHVSIHRQNLDIKKLNNKLEQQTIYIQSLENSVSDLKKTLEEARSDVKRNEVFSQIFKQNLELI